MDANCFKYNQNNWWFEYNRKESLIKPRNLTYERGTKTFKKKVLLANLGEVILFKSSLLHKSCVNKSKTKMRYVLNTFYHDMSYKNCKYKDLEQKK